MRSARRRGAAALLLAAGAAAACVAIETAPGGVQSVRLDPPPPSVVVGDVLRDSTGAATALNAVAFDADGRPAATARVRYAFVPVADTTGTGVRDTSLVVDSVTGVVRATAPLRRATGRVAAVVGDRLQLLDTLDIVFAPDSLVPDTATISELRYDCTDPRTSARPVPAAADSAALFQWNAVALPAVTVRGADTAGTRVGIRSRLVRWDVDSGPFAGGRIPRAAATPGGRDSVPVIGIVDATGDALQPFDTTTTAGVSSARLRIRPYALGRDVVAAREFTVRVRVRGQPGPRALANDPLYFRVRLARTTTPVLGATETCP